MILEFIGNAPRTPYIRIGVSGNNLVDDLVFVLGRKQGKNDLYEFTPKIKITTPERDFAEYSGDDLTVEKIEERDTIKITYVLPEIVTERGNVDMLIVFEKPIDGGAVKTWHTLPFNVTFPEGIKESNAIMEAYPNIIRELIQNDKENFDVAEEAKNVADEALNISNDIKNNIIPSEIEAVKDFASMAADNVQYQAYDYTDNKVLEASVSIGSEVERVEASVKAYTDEQIAKVSGSDTVYVEDFEEKRIKNIPVGAYPLAFVDKIGGKTEKVTEYGAPIGSYTPTSEVTESDGKYSVTIPPRSEGYDGVWFDLGTFEAYLDPYATYIFNYEVSGNALYLEFRLSNADDNTTVPKNKEFSPIDYGLTGSVMLTMDHPTADNLTEETQTVTFSFSLRPVLKKLVPAPVTSVISLSKNLVNDKSTFSSLGWSRQDNGYWLGKSVKEGLLYQNVYGLKDVMCVTCTAKLLTAGAETLTPLLIRVVYTDGTTDELLGSRTGTQFDFEVYRRRSKNTNPNKVVDKITTFYASTGTFEIKDLMINLVPKESASEGAYALPYEPNSYADQYLIPSAITSLDGYGEGISKNICNFVVFDDLKYSRRVKRKTFDGTEEWVGGESDISPAMFQYFITINDKVVAHDTENAQCTYFYNIDSVDDAQIGGFVEILGSKEIVFFTDIPTIEEWKTHLAELNGYGAPLTLLYQAEETENVDLDPSMDINPISIVNGNMLVFDNELDADIPNTIEYVKKASKGEVQ